MKSYYKQIFFSVVMLCVSFISFAVPVIPDPNDDPISDDSQEIAAPINTKLIWLAIVGIAFVYYQFNLKRKKA